MLIFHLVALHKECLNWVMSFFLVPFTIEVEEIVFILLY